jgi:thiol:disulfide interchange protein
MKVLSLIIKSIMALLALPLFGFILYFFRGSLEEFPTDEQQEKVRVVSGVFIAGLLLVELLLFLIVRKIKPSQVYK